MTTAPSRSVRNPGLRSWNMRMYPCGVRLGPGYRLGAGLPFLRDKRGETGTRLGPTRRVLGQHAPARTIASDEPGDQGRAPMPGPVR